MRVGGVGPYGTWNDAGWNWTLGVNFMAVVWDIEIFTPRIENKGGGHIVSTASSRSTPYNVSKYGMVALSEGLRNELGPRGIGVSVLCPGFIRTNIVNSQRNLPERFAEVTGACCPSRKLHRASKCWQHGRCCRPMWDLCKLIWWAFIGLFRLRVALVAENLVLRQQIDVLRRTAPKRLRFGSIDRLIFVGLFRGLSTARDALTIVQPATA
jgi:NAD(P)-dependent dehydrogenase (short-subunit alcohol dehydrogenase family)